VDPHAYPGPPYEVIYTYDGRAYLSNRTLSVSAYSYPGPYAQYADRRDDLACGSAWVRPSDKRTRDERAEALLLQHLSPKQRQQLTVTHASTPYRFFDEERGSVLHRRSYRIYLTYDHAEVERHCIGADRSLPVADQALQLLLALRADEEKFRTVAGTSNVYR
jgi:hypothetical protein